MATETSDARDASPSPSPAEAHQADIPRQWPCPVALITAPFLPATTARRTLHARLPVALVMHVLALALSIGCFVAMDDYMMATESDVAFWAGETVGGFGLRINMLLLLLAILLSQVLSPLLGAVVMCWGAADEPLRKSYANSLRRIWLQSGHALLLVAATMAAVGYLLNAKLDWVPQALGKPLWLSASTLYEAEARRVLSAAPWHIRYAHELAILAVVALIAWFVWASLRALATPRPVPRVDRPGTCGACGYNLTGLKPEGRCPECGEPIAASAGPDARPGTPWQRRDGIGLATSAWRTLRLATVSPRTLGRSIRLTSRDGRHRSYLGLALVPLFLIGAATPVLARIAGAPPLPEETPWIRTGVDAIAAGCSVAVAALIVVITTASLAGLTYRVTLGRNLLAGTIQAAAYQVSLLIVWAAIPAGATIIAPACGVFDSDLVIGLWCSFYVIMWLIYAWRVGRTSRGFRYATV